MAHDDPTAPPAQARPDDERARALEDDLDDAREEVEHIEDRGAGDTGTPEPHRRLLEQGADDDTAPWARRGAARTRGGRGSGNGRGMAGGELPTVRSPA